MIPERFPNGLISRLKELALETPIEVAEEELGLDIRKRFGAKPPDEGGWRNQSFSL